MKIFKEIAQQTPEWFKLRAWVLTWSILSDIMSWWYNKDWSLNATAIKAMKWLMYKLIGWEFSYDEEAPKVSNYLMWKWNELEPIARAKYEDLMWVKVEEIWFIKKNDWLWLSPDWCIMKPETWKYSKHIEIKCPLWNDSAKFYKYMFEWLEAIKNDTDKYIWQIVHNFIVNSDLEEMDFIIFNPNLPKEKQLFIINIKKEEIQEEIEKAQQRILEFREIWEKHITLLIK